VDGTSNAATATQPVVSNPVCPPEGNGFCNAPLPHLNLQSVSAGPSAFFLIRLALGLGFLEIVGNNPPNKDHEI
jgi:hypothetical protein